MKHKVLFFFLWCLVAALPGDPGFPENLPAKNQRVFHAPPASAVLIGERLVFDVFWMGVPVGTGELEVKEKIVKNGREVYHVRAVARTNEFLSRLYPVNDEIHSFMDAEDFHSVEFRKTLNEGRYRADEKTVFDVQTKTGLYESLLNHSKKTFATGGKVYDILSAFFWFRHQPIASDKVLRVTVNSEEKDWSIEIRVLGTAKRELRGKRVIDTVLVEPRTRLKEVFYSRGTAWIYFSADRRRRPVWITFKTPFGPVVGVLRDGGPDEG